MPLDKRIFTPREMELRLMLAKCLGHLDAFKREKEIPDWIKGAINVTQLDILDTIERVKTMDHYHEQ